MAQKFFRIEGLDRILGILESISEQAVSGEVLEEIGAFITEAILTRTAEGRDITGNLFEPYSPKYRLFRMEKGYPVNKVDLYFSGSMLSSLTHTVYDDRVEVFFMPTYGKDASGKPSKVSNPAKAFFLQEDRKFFGLSAQEQSEILGMMHVHLQRIMQRE